MCDFSVICDIFVFLQLEKLQKKMSDFQLYVNTLLILIPVLTSSVCLTLVSFSIRNSITPQERRLKMITNSDFFYS